MGSNLRAWLYSVTRNLFVNQLRHATGRVDQLTVDIDGLADVLHAPPGHSEDTVDLQRCLLRLPPEQREVLLLVGMEGMSYAEVAKVTGVPIGTVMSRLSRARACLQTLLEAPARTVQDLPTQAFKPMPFKTLRRLKQSCHHHDARPYPPTDRR